MYEIMSDLGKYLVNRCALCLRGSNMPRPPIRLFYIIFMFKMTDFIIFAERFTFF